MTPDDLDARWDYGDPVKSQARFREAMAEVPFGTNPDLHLQAQTQLARAQGLAGDFETAHRTLDEVESKLTDLTPLARVRYLLERGRAFNGFPRPWKEGDEAAARAMPLFMEAYQAGKAVGVDRYTIDAMHMIALVSPPDDALTWNQRALEAAEASGQPGGQRWRGPLYNNLGWTLFELGRYDEALALFEKDADYRKELGKTGPARIARWSAAKTKRKLDRTEDALADQLALLAEYEADGASDPYVWEELGECLLALERGDEARGYFALAFDALSKDDWFVENEAERLARLERLSKATAP